MHKPQSTPKVEIKTDVKPSSVRAADPSCRKNGTETMCLHEAVNRCLANYFKNLKGMAPAPNLFESIMGEVEKPLLEQVLKYVRGNQLRAAEVLGINRNTLRKKIRQWGLDKAPKAMAKTSSAPNAPIGKE